MRITLRQPVQGYFEFDSRRHVLGEFGHFSGFFGAEEVKSRFFLEIGKIGKYA